MPTETLCIVGAGGHARVVADALVCSGSHAGRSICFVDDRQELHGRELLGRPVIGPVSVIAAGMAFHVAIGSGKTRECVQRKLIAAGAQPITIVHPRATVSEHARIGPGSFIAAGAVVSALALVGEGVIVNHNAVIDHDCEVGAWSHIAPSATLGGGASVGIEAMVGAGAVLLPGKRVGNGVVVGAGAVVTRDMPDGVSCRGVPARQYAR